MKSRSDKAHKENDAYYSSVMCVIAQRQGSDHPAGYYLPYFNKVIEDGNSSYALDRKTLDQDEAQRVIAAYLSLDGTQKAQSQSDDAACRSAVLMALTARHPG
ncbi:hypothetical protein [Chimaeribacter californicus]|nr:hypothetical protein [Chimaeribacter californicus]